MRERRLTYFAELIQRANTPFAIGFNAHDFVQPHNLRGATRSESGSRMLDPVMLWV